MKIKHFSILFISYISLVLLSCNIGVNDLKSPSNSVSNNLIDTRYTKDSNLRAVQSTVNRGGCLSDAWGGGLTASCPVTTTTTQTVYTTTSSSPSRFTYSGNGYYTYPAVSLNATVGCTLSYSAFPNDIPNRFTVRDPSGNIVATSGWIYSTVPNYNGPWNFGNGQMLSNYIGSISVTISGVYSLIVETQTNVANGGLSDSWDGGLTTSCPNIQTVTTTSIVTTSTNPTNFTYLSSGYYSYPPLTLSASIGCTLSYSLFPNDVPNRFTIKDPAGNIVATSGWIYSTVPNYTGPWSNGNGQMVSNYIGSFTASMNGSYSLVVETVVGTNCGGGGTRGGIK